MEIQQYIWLLDRKQKNQSSTKIVASVNGTGNFISIKTLGLENRQHYIWVQFMVIWRNKAFLQILQIYGGEFFDQSAWSLVKDV